MAPSEDFPLVSGHLSLDLVNTEIVRRGMRHNLLTTVEDLVRWVHTMESAGLNAASLPYRFDTPEALNSLLVLRDLFRSAFENTIDGTTPAPDFQAHLESLTANAPFSFKVAGKDLVPVPVGDASDSLTSLVALDALQLLASGEIHSLRRCSNPDCVLLFLDKSGKRKWCSMKICGNRAKVARFEKRIQTGK